MPWPSRPVLERFQEKVLVTDSCWLWTGAKDTHGYGNFWWSGYVKAHQAAWRLFNGEIPDGKEIDHVVCANPPCVNPAHLELVDISGRENTARHYAKQTHCIAGHEYTEENTYRVPGSGHRQCIICKREAWQRYKHSH